MTLFRHIAESLYFQNLVLFSALPHGLGSHEVYHLLFVLIPTLKSLTRGLLVFIWKETVNNHFLLTPSIVIRISETSTLPHFPLTLFRVQKLLSVFVQKSFVLTPNYSPFHLSVPFPVP